MTELLFLSGRASHAREPDGRNGLGEQTGSDERNGLDWTDDWTSALEEWSGAKESHPCFPLFVIEHFCYTTNPLPWRLVSWEWGQQLTKWKPVLDQVEGCYGPSGR